jgi:hypothetical protein
MGTRVTAACDREEDMKYRMTTSATAFIALLAGTFACGAERSQTTSALQTQEAASLTVRNDHWLDVTIYAVRGGTRQRIGTVAGQKTETLPLEKTILAGAGTIRFLVEPIGSAQSHVTESISIGPSDTVELQVRNPLNLTTYSVARR